MKKTVLTAAILLLTSAVSHAASDMADMVDMFMGVRGNSNCVIGPQLPHGSVNPSPQTPAGGQNGYDEGDLIRGFGQLHVSGIGWSRYGQVFLSPQIGFSAKENGHDSPKSGEKATPYYYKVNLDRYDITAEMAPTHHAVAYRFTYPERKNKTLLVDMRHSIPQHIVPIVRGTFNGGGLSWDPATSVLSGWGEYAGGFGSEEPYKVYFSMHIDDPDCKVSIVDRGSKELYARIDISKPVVNVGVGVSLRSVDRAGKYRYLELENKNVDRVAELAKAEWERALGRIEVEGDESDKRLFYTALYHSLVMPREADGTRIAIDAAKVYGPWVDYFYEGNSWTYTLFTPSHIERLIKLCGGKKEMLRRLQYGFDNGLVDIANEPGFLAPFIFSHCDRPDLTADYVDAIRHRSFSIEKGYPDNEDSGAMGSWYVFTSIGLFPNAGQDFYYLIPPAFSRADLTMENGKKITVTARRRSPDARYIASVTLNGCTLNRSWIRHDEIAQGAVIEYELSSDPTEWALAEFQSTRERRHPFGVNLAGAEFFHKKMDGVGRFNIDYHYPTTRELDYWASKDMKLIRLPFKWERLQREVEGPLSADELEYIRYLLRQADERDMKILLDMHNYGRRKYMGRNRIIGDTLQPAHFAQAWAAIARELKDEPALYGYGLCNEPHDMLPECPWVEIAQTAIDSIRAVDRRTAIVVAGNTWSSAERWPEINQGLESLRDPSDNLIYEAHCYFDNDASGIYRKGYDEEEAYPTIGIDRARPFVDWLKKHGKRGMFGEYGVPADDPRWLECLELFLDYLAENGVEGTYWAAGARWNKYILGVHPENNYSVDRPQVEIMSKYSLTR